MFASLHPSQGQPAHAPRRLALATASRFAEGSADTSAIGDPERFGSSKAVGPRFGPTPKRPRSGGTDVTGRLSNTGDAGVGSAPHKAAGVIPTPPVEGTAPKNRVAHRPHRPGTGCHVLHRTDTRPAAI